jgi:hypothetical protein
MQHKQVPGQQKMRAIKQAQQPRSVHFKTNRSFFDTFIQKHDGFWQNQAFLTGMFLAELLAETIKRSMP